MPVTPANQLFQASGLADNPILSAIAVLSQRRQDAIDEQERQEQLKLEREQRQQEIDLRNKQFQLSKQQIEAALKQAEANEAFQAFQFETGAPNLAGAVQAGTLGAGDSFVDPLTGQQRTLEEDFVKGIQEREQELFRQKVFIPQAQMESRERSMLMQLLSREQQAAATNAMRKEMHNDNMQIQQARLDAQRRKASGENISSTSFAAKDLASAGAKLSGDLYVDAPIIQQLSPAEKAVISGQMDVTDLVKRGEDLTKFTNDLGKIGFVIPNFDPKQLATYREEKGLMNEIVNQASILADSSVNIGSDKIAAFNSVEEFFLSNFNASHPAIQASKALAAFAPKLANLLGQGKGVLSDKDISLIRESIPDLKTDSPSVRAKKVQTLIRVIQQAEDRFFGSIPKSQKEYILETNQIPELNATQRSFIPPEDPNSPESLLNQ